MTKPRQPNRCPLCRAVIPSNRLFCKAHWEAQPKDERDELMAAYRNRRRDPRLHRALALEMVRVAYERERDGSS